MTIAALVTAWLIAATLARALGIWLAVGVTAVLLGVVLLIVERVTLLPRLRPTAQGLILGAGAGAGMIIATVMLTPALLWLPGGAEELALLYTGFAALPPWAALLSLVPIIAGEELVWRGIVQAHVARRLGETRAVPVAAALYAVAHAPIGSWVLCLAAGACGLVWAALAARTRGLVAPFVAHLVWDVVVLFVAPLSPM